MKKCLSLLMIAVLLLGCLPLASCGAEPLEYVTIQKLKNASSGKLKDLRESLSCFDEITEQYKDTDLVCIITDRAEGDVSVFNSINNDDVVLLTAYPNAGKHITSIELSSHRYIDNVCNFEDAGSVLTKIDFNPKSQCRIYHSFNHCDKLKKLELSRCQQDICGSFNSCDSLQSVTFGAVPDVLSDSFNDDPSLTAVSVDRAADHAENSFQNTGDIQWTVRGKEYYDDELKELKNNCQNAALQKLADSGVIPQPEKNENDDLIPAFDDDGDMAFLDKDAKAKLYEKPDFKLTKFYLVNYPTVGNGASISEELMYHEERMTEGEIRYLAVETCFITKEIKTNYIWVPAANRSAPDTGDTPAVSLMSSSPNNSLSVIPVADDDSPGITVSVVSTFLYVIDVSTGEIIHIHHVGTDDPDPADNRVQGAFLYEEAQDYLLTLL